MSESVATDDGAPAPRPWYRHLWPWLLMLPPVAAVGGGITMIWLATHTPATLVVDDYAQIEEITAARFAADAQAARQGLTAEVEIRQDGDAEANLTVRLTGASGQPPEALLLRFRHATDAALDRHGVAQRQGNEFYARVSLGSGRYLLELEPADRAWRLATQLQATDRNGLFQLSGQQREGLLQ